jgi:subtilisin-like proprotein convertase family protein
MNKQVSGDFYQSSAAKFLLMITLILVLLWFASLVSIQAWGAGKAQFESTEEILPSATITPNPTSILADDEVTFEDPPTPTVISINFLPLIIRMPTPTPVLKPVQALLCSQPGLIIPDNNSSGITSHLNFTSSGYIQDINVFIQIEHSWVGDLSIILHKPDLGISASLVDRPGYPSTTYGCANNNIQAIFDDQASQPAENKCILSPAAIGGSFIPSTALQAFWGQSPAGQWQVQVIDSSSADTGKLQKWCIEFQILSIFPEPPTSTPPPNLPSSAAIYGMSGQNQALPLDCESRSAVDWAAFFGVHINEFEFFNRLPHSDNPDLGFVGNVNGQWGQIPPNDYGVHAEPVAALLRQYGLVASSGRLLHWDDLRAEIAAGRPVMVWITRDVGSGAPEYYISSSDQHITTVARYEHTVIVTGYTPNSVTILDGSKIYSRSLDQFLDSWSSLRNMAILARP